jgi:hypothetical protein
MVQGKMKTGINNMGRNSDKKVVERNDDEKSA